MSRKYRRKKSQNLPFINNVRPVMEFSDPPRRTALIMTAGVLITLAALLIFMLQR
jgi:hypothetical protein